MALSELFPGISREGLTVALSPERGSTTPTARAAVTDLRTENRVPIAMERPVAQILLPVTGWTAGAGDTFLASDVVIGNTGETAVWRFASGSWRPIARTDTLPT